MTDFHCHILPGMDDGSKSVEMSLQMLDADREMGIETVVATPHFYGYRERTERFLERRAASWEELSDAIESSGRQYPRILLGAEVAFYSGLLKHRHLDTLCVTGTKTLLLEMPFAQWGGLELDVVSTLCLDRGYEIVLAHLERFTSLQKNTAAMEQILRLPVWVQINAEAILPVTRRGKWVRMFRDGQAHLLGSDAHNMSSRPPNLGKGWEILRRKAGEPVLEEIDAVCERLLTPLEAAVDAAADAKV